MSQSLKCMAGALAVGLPLFASPVQAVPALPVSNLTFSVFTGVAPKNNFSAVNPTGWACGGVNCGQSNDLVFLDSSVAQAESATGGYGVYSLLTPPVPGNFVQADGNPDFDSVFYQSISGLTIGQTYELQFWQAAGQQSVPDPYTGATTEQWIVSLGTQVLSVSATCPGNLCTYSNADLGADTQASLLMNTPSQGNSAWNEVTMFLTADATTDIVSFLAWGDNGSTANLPPTVFLAGVNTPAVPEPASLSLFGAGLFGVGGLAVFRRRAKRKAVA